MEGVGALEIPPTDTLYDHDPTSHHTRTMVYFQCRLPNFVAESNGLWPRLNIVALWSHLLTISLETRLLSFGESVP